MAWWTHRTKTGRVVYDRPKNLFKPRDVIRILDPMDFPNVFSPDYFWTVALAVETVEKLRAAAPEGAAAAAELAAWTEQELEAHQDEFREFGGGDFGGGGASEPIDAPGAVRPPGESPFAIGPCGKPWFLMPIQPCRPEDLPF